jgi:glyoxylase-like metal-dependent hydrolase (beta-lactamase superfamily II)
MPKNNNEITNLLNLAEIKIDLISAGTWKGDGGVALGIMPKTLWGKFYPSDSENKILFDTNTLLIQTPKEKILVDTGFGNKLTQQQKKIFGISEYKLIKNLAYLNIRPEDIDYVILSHLHFDHAGGIVSSAKNKKKLTFPHATHLIQKKEWTMAKMPDFINKSSYHFNRDLALLEKSKQLKLLNGDFKLNDFVSLKLVGGHSLGLQIVKIHINNFFACFASDLFALELHKNLVVTTAADLYRATTITAKQSILHELAKYKGYLIFSHDLKNKYIQIK